MKIPAMLGVYAKPYRFRSIAILLAALPFVLCIFLYTINALERHAVNPSDKLMPLPSQMLEKFSSLATEESKRTGEIILVQDTISSLKRLIPGLALAALVGLALGLSMGLFPVIEAIFSPIVTFQSNVVPTAILPLLLIILGTGDASKIGLIFIGTVFIFINRIHSHTKDIRSQVTKSLTLGASQLQIGYEIMLPQLLPRLIDIARLAMGPAWIFLVTAEAITSTDGLGYRIFLVRRYLSMDVIIPYVLWITVLAICIDILLVMTRKYFFPWYKAKQG